LWHWLDSDGDMVSTAFTFGRNVNRGAWGIGPRTDNRDISSFASVLGARLT